MLLLYPQVAGTLIFFFLVSIYKQMAAMIIAFLRSNTLNSSAEDKYRKKNHHKSLKTEMLRHTSRVSHCINNYRGI